MEFQLRTGEVVDQTMYPIVPHMKSEEARLNTFSEWPADAPVQPEDLAAAGMYYLGTNDTVMCFSCGQQLAEWEPGDEAWGKHAKHNPNCFFILGHDVGNVLLTPRPRLNGQRASVETFEGRLETFRGRQHPIDPERLARAGFYSTGEQDHVLCFSCGGGLKERWLEDPWEEHARHYPGCSFLLAEKGVEYVNSVQLSYPKGGHLRSGQNGFSSHEEYILLQAIMARSSQDGEIEADDAWSSMPNRVSSFQHFPRSEEFSAAHLARAGFYFTGQADKVRCFSCHATVEVWNRGDAPLKRHQRASPNCKFLSGAHGLRASNLIQSPAYDEEAEAMEFQLRTGEVVDQTIVPHMKSEEARLNTFSEWPADAPVQPEDLAAAGMYYLGTNDTVRCFCCGQHLAGWQPDDEAWGKHAKHYPNCFFILGHDVGNVPLTPRPRVNGQRASVETFEGRLETFRGRQHPIDPERLARAGFYSTGEQDHVLCFRCRGGLKGRWPDEDPWEEHARHYPGCSFLLAEKRVEYVNSVQLRYPKGDHSRSGQNGFSSHEE